MHQHTDAECKLLPPHALIPLTVYSACQLLKALHTPVVHLAEHYIIRREIRHRLLLDSLAQSNPIWRLHWLRLCWTSVRQVQQLLR